MSAFRRPSLKVAWITDFPIEWISDIPVTLKHLSAQHARSWQQVLLQEWEHNSHVELHIFILRRNLQKNVTFNRNGVTFHVLKVMPLVREQSLYWVDTFLIARELRLIRPDIVHAWGTERGAHLVAQRLGYPYLVTIQGLVTWYAELIPLNIYERYAAFLERTWLPRSPLVTTESTFAVDYLHNRFPGLRVLQAEHAPNWIFHRVIRQPQTNPTRFLFVGHFGIRKGADLLIAALTRLGRDHPFELVVIGNVENQFDAELQKLEGNKAAERVIVRKQLSASEIAEELSRATMMLFPTRADTSPNAVKEAVVAGVPVVASAIGGITDYVLPNKNGFTFPSDDVEAFYEAILKACRHPLFSQGLVDSDTLVSTRQYLSPLKMGERFFEAYEILAGQRQMPNIPKLILPN